MQQPKLTLQDIQQLHRQFILPVNFQQIEHVPQGFMKQPINVQQSCLCVNYSFFEQAYPLLWSYLRKTAKENNQDRRWIAQTLLVMNGQNDTAWNIFKISLNTTQPILQRQLRFNAAICLKNKKSTSYYDYRITLHQKILSSKKHSVQELLQIWSREVVLIQRVLSRFFRNYFVWMYRNKLFKLFTSHHSQAYCQIEDCQINLLHHFIGKNPNDYSAYSRLIAVIRKNQSKYTTLIQKQKLWLKDLVQFCEAAFEKKQSYQHTTTYLKFLTSLEHHG